MNETEQDASSDGDEMQVTFLQRSSTEVNAELSSDLVECLCLNDRLLVGGASSGQIQLWSPFESKNIVKEWKGSTVDEGISSIQFISDNEIISSSGVEICVWDIRYLTDNSQPIFRHLSPQLEDINALHYRPANDSVFLCGDSGDFVCLGPVHSLNSIQSSCLVHPDSIAFALGFVESLSVCASGGMDCTLAFVDISCLDLTIPLRLSVKEIGNMENASPTANKTWLNPPQIHSVSCLDVSKDGQIECVCCVGLGNGCTQWWSVKKNTILTADHALTLPVDDNSATVGVSLFPLDDNVMTCSAHANGRIEIHQLNLEEEKWTYQESTEHMHNERISCLASSIRSASCVPVADMKGHVLLLDMT